MFLTLDLDTGLLVVSAGNATPVTSMTAPYGEGTEIRIRCVRSGQTTTLPETATLSFTAKANVSAEAAVYLEDFTLTDGLYIGYANFATSVMAALLTGLAEKEIKAQVAWRTADEAPLQRSQIFNLTVAQSIADEEGASPLPLPPGFRAVLSADGYYFEVYNGDTLVGRLKILNPPA